ncbi:MAG: serine/threonine-protein kinase, partial [Polyangiales bacterium]
LDGVLLFDLLEREERLDWERALHIGRHVLSALDYAHGAGIIHRDIKPENVILVKQDDDPDFAKILDFGIAKLIDDVQPETDTAPLINDARLTQHGVTIGTPTYIAPEQAYGQPIDGRADLYSLSIMLYEMIAGVPPFDADEVGTLLRMHGTAEVPSFSVTAPDVHVPEAVEALIRHGLEKIADHRIGSAKQYIDRIDQIIPRKAEGGSGLREIPSIVVDGVRDAIGPAVVRAMNYKKSLRHWVAAALLLVAMTATLAFAFASDAPDYRPKGPLLPLGQPALGAEVETAAQMLSEGHPKEAAAYLISQAKQVRDEPYAQMVLGHAQASGQRSIQALMAYKSAVSLEPSLAHDKLMRTNIELILDKKAPGIVDAAIDFLGTLVTVANDGAAADQLVDLASSSKVSWRRHKALEVAEAVGLGDRVDRLGSYLLDLEHEESCPQRKEAVAKLRALGNKKAIPALRAARKRMRTGSGLIQRKVNTNACLRADAAEAIRYLQSL